MHAGECDDSTDSKFVTLQRRIFGLGLPQSDTMSVFRHVCVRQISQKISFEDLEALLLPNLVYVVSHGVHTA